MSEYAKQNEKKIMLLIRIMDKCDELVRQGKMSKNRRGRIWTRVSEEWDKYYNQHPDISPSIKENFNKLYEGLI